MKINMKELLLRVIILREIFLLGISTETASPDVDATGILPILTSPLWLSFVLAAGLKPVAKGLTK